MLVKEAGDMPLAIVPPYIVGAAWKESAPVSKYRQGNYLMITFSIFKWNIVQLMHSVEV